MSDLTKGKELSKPEEAMRPVANPGASITELWPFLLLLAALVLPFDVGVRRIALPFAEMLAKAFAWMRLRKASRATAPVEATVGRLHQAKQRAQKPGTPESPEAAPQQPVTTAPPAAAPTKAAGGNLSAGNKLLEAKRKRQEKED